MSGRRIILALFRFVVSLSNLILLLSVYLPVHFGGQVWGAADTLRPVEDRAYISWTAYPSGDDWDCFDDTTANEDVNYVYTTGTDVTYRQGWGHSDWTEGTIDSVMLMVRPRSPATAGTPEIIFGRFYYAGESVWGWCTSGAGTDTIDLSSSYTDSSITWTTDPYDGGAWTQARLNSTSMAWGWENRAIGTKPDSFGLNSGSATWANPIHKIEAQVFNTGANNSGELASIRWLVDDATPTGNVKMSIHTDSGGYPDDLLWGDNTGQAVVNGWNTVNVSGVTLDANTDYWLAYKEDAVNGIRYQSATGAGTHRYRARTGIYDSTWESDTDPAYWPYSGSDSYVMKGVFAVPDNRVTMSEVVVFYHTGVVVGKARERRIRNLREANE